MNQVKTRFFSFNELNTIITFVVVVVIFSVFTPNHLFIDARNLASMAKLIPDIGIVALGVGILMVAGEFDLSVSSVLPLCSFVFVKFLETGMYPVLALLLTLPVGAALGFINGMIMVKTGLPSFIITLSTMLFIKGLLFSVSKMMPISLFKYLPSSASFTLALTGTIGRFPVQFIWLLGIAIVLGVILRRNKFGNWIYATGSNQEAARAMGVNIGLVKISLYMLIGVLCAFAGIMQATRLGSFAATQGVGFELQAIAAVVVGGTSLRGGIGSVWGMFLGLFIIKTIETGLILMRVPVFGVETFIGIAVILFVIINETLNRRSGK
ncbi:MAG: ABC transporter permease [Spirochaetales bacterium]|nr:MAG: ABC transporter permease [Spirochaetales bacterium]